MITIKDLWKSYGETPVLKGLSLHAPAGSITVVLGQSGVGKSVLLKQIAGLEQPDKGTISIGGELLHPQRHGKDVGMLFQNSALFDSMNVEENVGFALRHRKGALTSADIHEAVASALCKVHLPGFQKKHPSELSGGQRRRVALARLLVYHPKILLFDEPTTGLDPITGQQIATLIRTTQKHLGATAILVTHDGATAANIGDYFALHKEGVISSFGDRNWFLSCKDPLVQSFLGHTSEESAKP